MPSQRFKGFTVFKSLEGIKRLEGLEGLEGKSGHKKPLMCGAGWLLAAR